MLPSISWTSTLFKRIQTEKAFSTLFYALFNYGYGIFQILNIDTQEELNELLDGFVEDYQVFDSRSDAVWYLNELCIELERAETFYPGLTYRNAYLEKSQKFIEELLLQELKKRNQDNFLEYIEKLLYGDRALAPEMYDKYEDQLLLVPYSVVQNGTQVLKEIEPALFESTQVDRYYLERFGRWRKFYLEAAKKGEAVVIRFS